MYHHAAHLQEFKKGLKVGHKVRRGDVIGKVGKTGTRYAHLHYEVMRQKPERWNQYVYGISGPLSREQVAARYLDPESFINRSEAIPAPYTTFGGYEYLDPINRAGTAFHAGIDLNEGWGDQDLGNDVKCPIDGEIVHIGRMDGGWGNHIWVKQEEEHPKLDASFGLKHAGKIFLSVQERGEAYYVTPDGVKYYMGSTPQEMLEFVQKTGIGISKEDLAKIPKGT
jgi:murein DD-endopeptidase MepM/ murein hydrolase activator NlpD